MSGKGKLNYVIFSDAATTESNGRSLSLSCVFMRNSRRSF
jgi:hypothetical protein